MLSEVGVGGITSGGHWATAIQVWAATLTISREDDIFALLAANISQLFLTIQYTTCARSVHRMV